MHTLLIDDDPITAFLTQRILAREGLTDTAASFQSPTEALTFLPGQIPAGLVPRVIFVGPEHAPDKQVGLSGPAQTIPDATGVVW